jgi:hypothetical protein
MNVVARQSTNPLDATMTRAQVVRRKFRSSLPRTVPDKLLSKMEAMARTMQLFDRLRNEMEEAGLKETDAHAGLVYCQPQTKGEELVLARVIALPSPEEIGKFADRVMALHKPLFLGVVFIQEDHDAKKEAQKITAFASPFILGPEYEGRLLAAMKQQANGGYKKRVS